MKLPIVALLACAALGAAASAGEPSEPERVFRERILPILRSPDPSSCIECHLAAVDLKDFLRPTADETFLSLRDRGLVDVKNPTGSKILTMIRMAPRTPSPISSKRRAQEAEAFEAWIVASCAQPALADAPPLEASKRGDWRRPVEVIRHGRDDQVLARFIDQFWRDTERCLSCHAPPGNQKQVEKFGDRVSWIVAGAPRATMLGLVERKFLDLDAPEKSLILRKSTEQVPHAGGRKILIGDETYTRWIGWIRDYARAAKDGYATARDLPATPAEFELASDCWVRVENKGKRVYIRRGLNQNNGTPQRDCFILRRDGTIEGAIDGDYDTITRVEAQPIDERPLVLKGGIFSTTANRMTQDKGYNYWSRNIVITRSNTTVTGLTHHIVGETAVGHPYSGFLVASGCANVTLRDCFVSGHKTYTTIGAAGKPVSMGTYDISANEVVNFTMIGCRMDNICDPTRWGVIGTNFCKNILLENCTLSRMDTHQGVSGTYTIRGCTLGHAGLNAIGRGVLTVENSTLNGRSLVSLRGDYGSTWEGSVVIRNSRWIPACGAAVQPTLLAASNDGQHDFGYPCFMPREITIDGLVIDDSHAPKDYQGPYLFTDPDGANPSAGNRPFPYRLTEQVTIRNLTTASGKKLRTSPDAEFNARVRVVEAK